MKNSTEKFRWCNHHHELTERHEVVDFGDGPFVANKEAIPLLKALNDVGMRTRTHHYNGEDHGFVSILLDNVSVEIRQVNEVDATRTKYNGKFEVILLWRKNPSLR